MKQINEIGIVAIIIITEKSRINIGVDTFIISYYTKENKFLSRNGDSTTYKKVVEVLFKI